MAAPAPTEARRRPRLAYAAAALGAAALSLLLLETLFARRLEQTRLRQLGSEVAGRLLLGEVALERCTSGAHRALGLQKNQDDTTNTCTRTRRRTL